MIYLDHNATTPLSPPALTAMRPFLELFHGNPSSIHAAGRLARAAIDDARDVLGQLLGARPHELIFTGGGTESDNLAVMGLARQFADTGKHLITSQIEHHAVLHACEYLEKQESFEVTYLPANPAGVVDIEAFRSAIRADTTLVSIMSANNETGTIQPLEEISAICREKGVLLHSDMIQSLGKQPIDLSLVDAASFASHKFYGPTGAGLLYLRSGISIQSLHHGGAHENQRRPGTENTAAIAGMASAAEEAIEEMADEQPRERALRDHLWASIHTAFPEAILNTDLNHCLSNTLNVSFPGLDGEALLFGLDLEGVCVSSGSACMVGSIQPSHVLLAMGVPADVAQATVRFSLGRENTIEEMDSTVEKLRKVVSRVHG
ncbi:MAG TPA: cysteine desulfurase family protein [Chthoniobacterales bacterium]